MQTCSGTRKASWDKKAQVKVFAKGDQVYMRKSGPKIKLTESWVGPYTVVKKNSPLSYRFNKGDQTIHYVYVQLLKQYTPREQHSSVRRVTTVLEPDTESDSMNNQYTEVSLSGVAQAESRDKVVKEWKDEFSDILTNEPCLTNSIEFKIDTGNHPPIC